MDNVDDKIKRVTVTFFPKPFSVLGVKTLRVLKTVRDDGISDFQNKPEDRPDLHIC